MTTESKTYSKFEGKSLKFNTAQDVAEICADISIMPHMTEIRLSANTFGVEACRAIAKSIASCHELKMIGFSDMFTGRLKDEIPLALDAFVEALEDKKNIVELDLSDNAFGPAGAKPLMRLITTNRTISTIKLNNNGLGIGGAAHISSALVEAHEKNVALNTKDSLSVFIAGRNRMESPGIVSLSKAFPLYAPTLTRLQMPQNSIRPDGIIVLMDALKLCTNLIHLDLQDNTFTESGSRALASALPHWPNLSILHVGDCLLSPKGGILVIKALTASHTSLMTLHLGFNEIDESGAKLIPEMLEDKAKLEKIELNGNCFDADCDAVEEIRVVLSGLGCPGALDELDEMEVESESEEEESEEEEEKEEKDVDVDELADAFSKKM